MADDIERRIDDLESGSVKPSRSTEQRNKFGGRDIVLKVVYEKTDADGKRGSVPLSYDKLDFDAIRPLENGDRIAIQWPKKRDDQ
jgi:hypothetical protein